jgi:AAA domain
MKRRRTEPLPTLDIQPVATYRKQPLEWLWPARFPLRKITMLSGDPELGKSLLTLDMAARISADRDWPDGTPAPRGGRALLLFAEDDVCDTIRGRLEAAGANLDRVDFLAGATDADAPDARLVSLEHDVQALAAATAGGNYRLIVIDPITTYLEGTDMNSQQAVRRILHGLARLAHDADAAVVLINHLRKQGDKGPAIYRTLGALAFAAVARAVWNVVRDPSDPLHRLLVPVKMNLTRRAQAAGFRIADPGVIDWDPDPIDLTADEVTPQSLSETDETDRLRRAKAWLYNFLEDGPKIANDVKSAAKRAGIPTRSLWDAKKALKVVSVRPEKASDPHAGRFEWRLPKDDYFLDGETEMLLTPSTSPGMPPGLDELIRNLQDPSWGMALGGR